MSDFKQAQLGRLLSLVVDQPRRSIEDLLIRFLPLAQYLKETLIGSSLNFGLLYEIADLLTLEPQLAHFLIVGLQNGGFLQVKLLVLTLLVGEHGFVTLVANFNGLLKDLFLLVQQLQFFREFLKVFLVLLVLFDLNAIMISYLLQLLHPLFQFLQLLLLLILQLIRLFDLVFQFIDLFLEESQPLCCIVDLCRVLVRHAARAHCHLFIAFAKEEFVHASLSFDLLVVKLLEKLFIILDFFL